MIPRIKQRAHADFVRNRPCLICGDDVHVEWCHIRTTFYPFVKDNAIGASADPWFTLPLCNRHHREEQDIGEAAFWERYFIGIRNALTVGTLLYCYGDNPDKADELLRRWRPPIGVIG